MPLLLVILIVVLGVMIERSRYPNEVMRAVIVLALLVMAAACVLVVEQYL